MSARLFAALPLPEHVSTDVTRVLNAVPADVRMSEQLRWVRREMWHVTLAFFGDVAEERQPELEERLGRVSSKHEALLLGLRGAGAFRSAVAAHAVWIGIANDAASQGEQPLRRERSPLVSVAESCAAAGRRVGLDLAVKPFRPHLTLARAKGRTSVDVRPFVNALAGYEGPSWTASEIVLMRSHLGPDPWYEPVGTWPLGYQA